MKKTPYFIQMKKNNSISQWSVEDRPREKFYAKGKDNLSDAELLSIIISSGNKSESALDLSKRMLKDFNNDLVRFSNLSVKNFTNYKGIGMVKAVSISAALEFGRRMQSSSAIDKGEINSSILCYEAIADKLLSKHQEECWVILLTRHNRFIDKICISKGGFDSAVVDGRIIFTKALEMRAAQFVLAHNHPSGNINPSESDIQLTKNIMRQALVMNIPLMDHIIVGHNNYFSFFDNNLLNI